MSLLLRGLFAAAVCVGVAHATGADTPGVSAADPARCLAAISANDDDRIIADCGALIDNDKTGKGDRAKALAARAGALARRGELDRAIADDDVLLRLDPQPDGFNARGELWWRKGDRPKALADFSSALKLNPDHAAAKDNYKKLAQELERLGAMMAVAGKPSFDCAKTPRPAEKAICADPALANLDRQINAVSGRVLRDAKGARERQTAQREQDDFIARRNADFGKPGYDMRQAMGERLQRLLDADRH